MLVCFSLFFLVGKALHLVAVDMSFNMMLMVVAAAIVIISISAYLLAMLFYVVAGKYSNLFVLCLVYGIVSVVFGLSFYLLVSTFVVLGFISLLAILGVRKFHCYRLLEC